MSTIATSGARVAHQRQEVVARLTAPDDLEPVVGEQALEPFAEEHAVFGDHDAHGTSALHPGAAADRRPDPQPAAERLDPIGEPAQAGSTFGVGATDTVVDDLDDERPCRGSPCVAGDEHRRRRRMRVLADVREALADDVVRGDLDRLRAAVRRCRRPARPAPARAPRAPRARPRDRARSRPRDGCRARRHAARRATPRSAGVPDRAAPSRPGPRRAAARADRGRARARPAAAARRRAGCAPAVAAPSARRRSRALAIRRARRPAPAGRPGAGRSRARCRRPR